MPHCYNTSGTPWQCKAACLVSGVLLLSMLISYESFVRLVFATGSNQRIFTDSAPWLGQSKCHLEKMSNVHIKIGTLFVSTVILPARNIKTDRTHGATTLAGNPKPTLPCATYITQLNFRSPHKLKIAPDYNELNSALVGAGRPLLDTL